MQESLGLLLGFSPFFRCARIVIRNDNFCSRWCCHFEGLFCFELRLRLRMNLNIVRELTEVSAYARNESWVPRDSKHKICTYTVFLNHKKSQFKIFVSKSSNLFPFNLTNFLRKFYELIIKTFLNITFLNFCAKTSSRSPHDFLSITSYIVASAL